MPPSKNQMQPELSREELIRYSRHLILPEVGTSGQLRLKSAKVLIVGAGGLGSPVALYLAASGVGQIGVVDFDRVDETNLHRQIIHTTLDVGRSKLDSAAEKLKAINPHVQIDKFDERLTRENALGIIGNYDIVVDGTDNFPTRYLVNDACVLLGKLNVYGSIYRFDGQATVFCAPSGPCYRCLYPEPPPPGLVPSCAEGGVLGVLPGLVGMIQSTETVKAILGVGRSLVGRLLLYDALEMSFKELKIRRDPECPICGDHPTQTELIDYEDFCGLRHALSPEEEPNGLDPSDIQALIRDKQSFELIDVREPFEYEISRIAGSKLIPLGELPSRMHELDRTKLVVVYCQLGSRSARAYHLLRANGFEKLAHLNGGIEAWSELK